MHGVGGHVGGLHEGLLVRGHVRHGGTHVVGRGVVHLWGLALVS